MHKLLLVTRSIHHETMIAFTMIVTYSYSAEEVVINMFSTLITKLFSPLSPRLRATWTLIVCSEAVALSIFKALLQVKVSEEVAKSLRESLSSSTIFRSSPSYITIISVKLLVKEEGSVMNLF